MDPAWINIEKLSLDNYTTWRIRITHLLKKEKLWRIVKGEELKPESSTSPGGTVTNPPATSAGSIEEWEEKDEAALSLLIENVKNICLGYLTSETTHLNWQQLEKIFQNKDVMNRWFLRQKYVNFKMTNGKNVTNHIHEFKLLLEELATVRLVYTEEDQVETLLAS